MLFAIRRNSLISQVNNIIHGMAIGIFQKIGNLTAAEKKTFGLHLMYSVFEGSIFGAFLMNEFVFLKSLRGSSYLLGVLFVFSMAVFLLLIVGNHVLSRNSNKRKLLRVTAVATRLPLLLFAFFPSDLNVYLGNPIWHYAFLSIFLLYYLSTPVTYPTMNLLLRSNYRIGHFGKLFGYANTVNKLFAFIATFVFGWLLETDYTVFRVVYPVCGLMGLASLLSLSVIPYEEEVSARDRSGFFTSVKHSFNHWVGLLKNNRPFLSFELGFMVYGLGFMLTVSAITLYLEGRLGLSYLSYAGYRNYAAVITILFMPVFSRFIDRIDPRSFARITYWLLLLYTLFILLTYWFPDHFMWNSYQIFPLLLVSFACLGFFNASMGLLWYIGSSYYCPDDRLSGDYQSVHLSFVGIRALIAPLAGVYFYETFGMVFTFGFAISILLAAIGMTLYSQRKTPLLGKPV
ncbi:MAG TPA: MFS transporter [Bacteroidales bacterium]|nr:MFS transporter [Bacteroidales bacterium]